MTLKQKRQRRVELLIDQRLVGFLKPMMTISTGPLRAFEPSNVVAELTLSRLKQRKDRAS